MAQEIKINWWTEADDRDYYAVWVDGEHDRNDDIPEGEDAESWLREQYPNATVCEVPATA